MKKTVAVFSIFLALTFIVGLVAPASAEVAIGISVRFGPPAIPVYAQPVCPAPGYFWVPGYWAWNDDYGYYWVPGTWVIAPVGMLWTPGYWGWNEGFYVWHAGYWGPHIGFYGGINYGFGYSGFGFWGGEWRGRDFYYNRSVTNVNVTNITNVYNKTVIVNNTTINRVSYNGGPGGIDVRPTREQIAAEREPHRFALPPQREQENAASQNRQLFASENHGRPAIAATMKPAEFTGRNVVAARAAGAAYHAPAMSPKDARGPAPSTSRSGNVSNPENARTNDGFQKFGQSNNGRAVDKNTGSNNWNNVARPGNKPAGNQQSGSNAGFQKFGQPNGNRNAQDNPRNAGNNVGSKNANESWRANRPNGQTATANSNVTKNAGSRNANDSWRANRPNGNAARPAGNASGSNRQAGSAQNPARPWRGGNQSQAQNRQHPAVQPHQNAPKASPPHNAKPPEQHPAREAAREPGREPGRRR